MVGWVDTSAASPNGARTAIGCLVLALAKEKKSPHFKTSFNFLQRGPLGGNLPAILPYYAAQAFFHASPTAWNEWNVEMSKTWQGAKTRMGVGMASSEAFSTAHHYCRLALNYRYLPIYER